MKGIIAFSQKVVRSCYDVEWYRTVRTFTVGAGLRYAALLHLLLAVVAAAVIVPGLLGFRAGVFAFLEKDLPADAYVALENGEFATNLETPFTRTVGGVTFIIDPSVEGERFPASITGNDPVILVGKRATYVQVDARDRRIMPTEASATGRVTVAEILPYVRQATVAIVVFAALCLAIAYGLFAFVLDVGFAWMAAYVLKWSGKRWGAPLAWDRWFVVALFAVTLPIVVDAVTIWLGIRTPFVYTGLFVLIASAVFLDEKQNPTMPHPAPEAPPAVPPVPTA